MIEAFSNCLTVRRTAWFQNHHNKGGVYKNAYESLPKTPAHDLVIMMKPEEKILVWYFKEYFHQVLLEKIAEQFTDVVTNEKFDMDPVFGENTQTSSKEILESNDFYERYIKALKPGYKEYMKRYTGEDKHWYGHVINSAKSAHAVSGLSDDKAIRAVSVYGLPAAIFETRSSGALITNIFEPGNPYTYWEKAFDRMKSFADPNANSIADGSYDDIDAVAHPYYALFVTLNEQRDINQLRERPNMMRNILLSSPILKRQRKKQKVRSFSSYDENPPVKNENGNLSEDDLNIEEVSQNVPAEVEAPEEYNSEIVLEPRELEDNDSNSDENESDWSNER